VVAGRPAGATAPSERYLVDTRDAGVDRLRERGLDVVHDISQIDLAAVRGTPDAVRRVASEYARDRPIQPSPPERPPEPESGTGSAVTVERSGTGSQSEVDAPFYAAQWDKQAFDLPALRDLSRGDGARVAILDSGIHTDHPDLRGQVNTDLSRDFTGDGYGTGSAYGGDHGTRCAGVVAANGSGLAGTAPDAELVDCRVFTFDRPGTYQSDYLAALVYSADIGCDVANLSLGPGITTPLQLALYDRPVHARAVEYAAQRDTVVVVAAGNDAIDLQRYGLRTFSPGPTTMVVSATGPLGFGWPLEDADGDGVIDTSELEAPIELAAPITEPSLYSNYGRDVLSVSAPGGNFDSVASSRDTFGWVLDMLLTDSVAVQRDATGEFTFESSWNWTIGTSFAAPQVTAVVALVRSLAPDMPVADVTALVERTATTVDDASPNPYHGAGFLDPLAAARAVE
jgi:subtilisin family serine protease